MDGSESAPVPDDDGVGADDLGPTSRAAVSVALVLSAGGAAAEAWHAGTVRALHEVAGWDARGADLIVGTSAGSISGLCLRAGIPPADLDARLRGDPISDEGRALIDRVVTPYSEGRSERDWYEHGIQSPTLAARALWPPWEARPLHAAVGLLPRGTRTTEALQRRLEELHPEPWPEQRFWATAVRLSDGERVVFGRDDVEVTAAEAVRASCAVPTRYEPVTVAGRRYVDGGVHSYTNADLAGPPAFDLVVVSSVMSGTPGWSRVRGALSEAWTHAASGIGLGGRQAPRDRAWWSDALESAWDDGRALRAARRHWVDDTLREEVGGLRNRGVSVLVVQPDPETVELIDAGVDESLGGPDDESPGSADDIGRSGPDDDLGRARATAIADSAAATVRRLLGTGPGRRFADMLHRASA